MIKIRICRICNKEFKSKNKNPICCSKHCMDIYKKTDEYKTRLYEFI